MRIQYFFTLLLLSFLLQQNQLPGQCPISVDAGPDKLVCNPGGTTTLEGSVSGPFLDFRWAPPTGLSSTTVLTPTATVNSTITYTLTAAAEDPSAPNLVNNPGFEDGNVGFTSSYAYNPLPVTPGTYVLTTSPALVLSTFPPCDDHTYGNGTGNMMLVNGTGAASSSIWCQTIPVMANSWYLLSAWIICSPISPPVMQFSVNGTNAGAPFPVSSGLCNWQQFTAVWYSGAATSANLCILDVSGSGNGFFGDDFALDDISMMKACTVSDQVTVSVASVNAVLPATIVLPCSAQANGIVLNGSASSSGPGYTYSWTGPGILSGENTPNVTVNEPGAYTLTVEYDTGNGVCTDEATINVLPDPNVANAVASANDDLTCINLTVGLSGAGSSVGPNFSYNWDPSFGIISGNGTLNPTVNQPGTYTLEVTNSISGCTATATATVNQYNTPAVAVASAPGLLTCLNSNLTLNGSGSSTGGDYSYFWTGPGIVSGATTLNNCVVNTAGTYTLLVSNDLSGCTATVNVAVNANNTAPVTMAAADAPGALNCTTSALNLNSAGSSTGAIYTYLWSTATGNIVGPADGANINVDAQGIYVLTITNTVNGCTSTATVNVNANTTPPEILVSQPIPTLNCGTSTVTLDAAGSASGAGITYNWSTFDGTILAGANTLTPVLGSAGEYSLLISDASNGCTNSETVTVVWDTLSPLTSILPPAQLDCNLSVVDLDATGSSSGSGYSVSWVFSPASGSSGPGFVSGQNTYLPSVNAAGTYTATITNLSNLCSSSDSVTVTQDANFPIADAGIAPLLDCNNPADTLNGSGSSQGPDFSYLWSNGDTLLLTPISTAGTYVLTVINATNGCAATDTLNVVYLGDLPDVAIDTPGVLTCALTQIQLSANASSGAEFIYVWTFAGTGNGIVSGDSTLTPTVVSTGDYLLTVSNTLTGCTATSMVNLQEAVTPPTADAGAQQTLLCGTVSAFLDGSASSTGANFSYVWTTINGNILQGDTTLMAEANAPGTYTLLVTDNTNGCTASDDVLLGIDASAPVADAGTAPSLTCSTTQVVLDGSNSSTGPSILYFWTTLDGTILSGENTTMPTVSDPGTYLLQVTNTSNNCQTIASVQVLDDTQAPLALAAAPQMLTCTQTSVSLDGSGSSVTGAVYQWSGPGILSGANGLAPVVNSPGIYTLTVTDQTNGCTATATATVSTNTTLPAANAFSTQDLTCIVLQASLDGTGSSTGASFLYQWSGPGIVSGANSLMPVVDASGLYTLIVTDQGNGCTTTATAMVMANLNPPTAMAAAPQPLNCVTLQTTLSGNGSSAGANFTYNWSGPGLVSGALTLAPVVNAPGNYTLTITDISNGCTAVAMVNLANQNTPPVAMASSAQPITCAQALVDVSGAGSSAGNNFQYAWSGPGLVSGGNTLMPMVDAAGTYTLLVTDQSNGCTAVATSLVAIDTVAPIAQAASGQMLNCTVAQITLSGAGSSSGPGFQYAWTGPAILSGANTLSPVVSAAGVYTLLVTNQMNGCASTASTVAQSDGSNVTVIVAAPDSLSCAISQISLDATASTSGPGFSYQWTTSTGAFVSGQTSLTPSVSTAGVYTLLITNNQNGCTGTAQVTVGSNAILPDIQAEPSLSINCDANSISLQSSSSTPGALFDWTTLDGNLLSGQNGPNPVISAVGTYTLVVTHPVSGCTASATVSVNSVNVDFPVATSTVPDCNSPLGSILFSGGWNGQLPFLYSVDNGLNFQQDSVFENLSPGIYQGLVQDGGGCEQNFSLEIPNFTAISVALPGTVTIDLGQVFALEPLLNIAATDIAAVQWSPGTGLSCTDCLRPNASPENDVTYTIVVSDVNGCSATASVDVVVTVPSEVFGPNAFSPNNDGWNDEFVVGTDLPLTQFEMQVFDRWGGLVFSSKDSAKGWDGTAKGKALNPGVYVYWIQLEYIDGKGVMQQKLVEGDVLLVR